MDKRAFKAIAEMMGGAATLAKLEMLLDVSLLLALKIEARLDEAEEKGDEVRLVNLEIERSFDRLRIALEARDASEKP